MARSDDVAPHRRTYGDSVGLQRRGRRAYIKGTGQMADQTATTPKSRWWKYAGTRILIGTVAAGVLACGALAAAGAGLAVVVVVVVVVVCWEPDGEAASGATAGTAGSSVGPGPVTPVGPLAPLAPLAPNAQPERGPLRLAAVSPPPRADSVARRTQRRGLLIGGLRRR